VTLGEFKPPKRDSEFYFQIFEFFWLAVCSSLYFAFQLKTDVLASFRLGGAYVKCKNNMFCWNSLALAPQNLACRVDWLSGKKGTLFAQSISSRVGAAARLLHAARVASGSSR